MTVSRKEIIEKIKKYIESDDFAAIEAYLKGLFMGENEQGN